MSYPACRLVLLQFATAIFIVMMPRSTLAILLFACLCISGVSSSKHGQEAARVTESIFPPPRWRKSNLAKDDTVIHLNIGLRHDGYHELERRLYEVSSPSHSQYGRHLTRKELEKLLRPPQETINLVRDWLYGRGITQVNYSSGGDWITASAPVRQVEALLDCRYHEFLNIENNETIIRTLKWSMPEYLREHVDVIQPTNSFFRAMPQDRYGGIPQPDWERNRRVPTYEELVEEDLVDRGHLDTPTIEELPANPTIKDACNRLAVTPLCLRVLYGTFGYRVQNDTNKVGVVNFLGNGNNRSDIMRYLKVYRPDALEGGGTDYFETTLVAGATDEQTPNTPEQFDQRMGLESALDIETLLGVAYPVPIIAWNVGGKPPFRPSQNKPQNTNEPYMDWLNYVLAQDHLPQVISISYADEEQTVPESYAKRVCAAFAQLGARGVSVIVASGDEGVGKDGRCYSNDGENKAKFMPTFPASCPFVTAVGGTRNFNPVIAGFDARGGFVTGGGFSDYFPRPKYQNDAVKPYIEGVNTTYDGLYNPQGRGIPDVSAMAYHYSIVWNGTSHLVDGTSASAPTFAAIISLINDNLLNEGRPPLGFLNPWLYTSARDGFRDVVHGSNRGCGTQGFEAVPGWDAATGLGTPWFPRLREVALNTTFRWQHPWYIVE
ncbi:Pro-kumamolisin [Xylaria bambusicola]|uniref:Pro-kumamolisin n=1 Tax=Xylaria bambusicola TaxID=326684 RepID=UPI0020084FCD|nr:Pro-kumamolisin [Xylaria bambusicola]KAI0505389.1 Pro-kumamolisin [Xylaria bambusicola]